MRRYQRGSFELVFLLVLAASLLANAWLWRSLGKEHDLRTMADANLQTANSATASCNASIDELEHQARDRAASNAKLIADAQARRRRAERTAQQILATPATVPGDDCKSAQDRVSRWLQERSKP
jgi:hypothetical protein